MMKTTMLLIALMASTSSVMAGGCYQSYEKCKPPVTVDTPDSLNPMDARLCDCGPNTYTRNYDQPLKQHDSHH